MPIDDQYSETAKPKWDTLSIAWSSPKPLNYQTPTFSSLRPILIGDSLVVFGYGSGLACLRTLNGSVKWATDLHTGLHASNAWESVDIVMEGPRMYVVAGNDALRGSEACIVCISSIDGSVIWRHDLPQDSRFAWHWSKYAVSPNAVFYSTMNSHVVALAKSDGSVLWDSPNGSVKPVLFEIDQGSPSYSKGVVYVGSGVGATDGLREDGGLTALDASSGRVIWQMILPRADSSTGYSNPNLLTDNQVSMPPLPTPEGVIVAAGFCLALIDSAGTVRWMRAPTVTGGLSLYAQQPLLTGGRLYGLNNGNGSFFCFALDAMSGNTLWCRSPFEHIVATCNHPSPVIDSGVLYVESDASELYGQRLSDGTRTLFTPFFYYLDGNDAPSGQFLVASGHVYFQSHNKIVCLALR